MRTIAVLTMFFLPATFVSSLFGTNLFSLDTNAVGQSTFVISKFWWIYLVTAIPLTILTLVCWGLYLKWRAFRERKILSSQQSTPHGIEELELLTR